MLDYEENPSCKMKSFKFSYSQPIKYIYFVNNDPKTIGTCNTAIPRTGIPYGGDKLWLQKSGSSAFSISVFLPFCGFLQLKFSANVYIFKALSQSKLRSSFWQTWLLDCVNIDWEFQLKKTTEMQKNGNTENRWGHCMSMWQLWSVLI